MAEGRQRHDWRQTSTVLAMLANTAANRTKKHRVAEPSDFDPFAKRAVAGPKIKIADLKGRFTKMGFKVRKASRPDAGQKERP